MGRRAGDRQVKVCRGDRGRDKEEYIDESDRGRGKGEGGRQGKNCNDHHPRAFFLPENPFTT